MNTEVQAFLEKALTRMLRRFMLTHYSVKLIYEKGLTSIMEIDVDHEYLEADISYGKTALELYYSVDKRELLKTLCHEVTHILTSRLTEKRNGLSKKRFLEIEEATNEHISKIFWRSL